MSNELMLDIPPRDKEEPDITQRQMDFIDNLYESLDLSKGSFNVAALSRWQASSLIDQLIELRDEGPGAGKVISFREDARNISKKDRKVSLILGLGIFICPYIFSWLTLRLGHSSTSRIVSFAWLGWFFYTMYTALKV